MRQEGRNGTDEERGSKGGMERELGIAAVNDDDRLSSASSYCSDPSDSE